MIKITPISFYTPRQKNKKKYISFSSNPHDSQNLTLSGLHYKSTTAKKSPELPWVKDKNILKSIEYLSHLQFNENDVKYIQSLNIVLPVLSGEEAINFAKSSRINIKFSQLPSRNVHAQYDFDNNCIKINEIYKKTQNPAEILAISEAILHEIGHAKDKDGKNSIQEEIECLALNTLAHRVFSRNFSNIFVDEESPIIKNGVCVYFEMFFDKDPFKLALIARLKEKYGYLPAGDFNHSPNEIALQVKSGNV